ncbi:hypothetical protein Sjap_008547 [Stephania japonica]|uniref:Uncharacterized protein n=1 Tax=Stephania japonica TaxID=461633 RepID=A0AAP0JPP9_9MAGN
MLGHVLDRFRVFGSLESSIRRIAKREEERGTRGAEVSQKSEEQREDQNPDYEPTELGFFHAVAPPGTVNMWYVFLWEAARSQEARVGLAKAPFLRFALRDSKMTGSALSSLTCGKLCC